MDYSRFFRVVSQKISDDVAGVRESQWADPTPCADWDVRQLLHHLVYETVWTPPLLKGKTIAEVGSKFDGDVLGDHPVEAWEAARVATQTAIEQLPSLEAPVHLSYGQRPARDYLEEFCGDLLIHSWDLARGLGREDRLDPALVTHVYNRVKKFAGDMHASGLFAKPAEVSASADLQTKLLALFGRQRDAAFK